MAGFCKHCGAKIDPKDEDCPNCGKKLVNESPSSDQVPSSAPIYHSKKASIVYCTNCRQVVSLQKSVDWYAILFLLICCCCGLIFYFIYYIGMKEPDTCPSCGEKLEYAHEMPLGR